MLSLIKIQKLCNLRENHLSLMEMISDKNNNLDKLYYNDFLCKKRRTKMKEPETGKKENTGKSGYSITTWRLHLWCRHPEWLRTTQEFYNRIAEFYYNLLLDHTDLWELGSQQTLRELEIMSIPGRGGRIPSDPLPWQKVPLYFRRAAANEGIASAKSYLSRFAQDEKIGRAEKLNAAVTYYKGMYQDFSAKEITLRVWTGDTWTWMHCRLSGRDFPENARLMSPSVVFEYKYDMLHVPVRQNNENTATSKIMLVTSTIQYFLQILILVFLKNYYVYLIVVLVTQIANNLITAAIVQYKYPNYVAMGELEKDEVKQINCRIRDLFTSKLGGVIVNSADTVVISAFLGLTKLAIYQNYYFIITSVIGVVGIVFSSCTAGIGNSMVTETIEKNYKDFKKFTFLVMAIVNFCTSCFLCLFQPFMEVWVGNELMLSFGMVVLFCIYFIDYECMALLSVYKDACGIWHHDRFRPLCEAGINLLLNLLLVNIGGLYGILLSTIISMSFVSLPWLVMNLFNFVFRRSSSEYISILIQNVIVVIVDMIVCYAICQMVHLGGIMTIIFRGAVCVVFSNISYFAIWKNNEDFKDAIKLLNSIFKGKR